MDEQNYVDKVEQIVVDLGILPTEDAMNKRQQLVDKALSRGRQQDLEDVISDMMCCHRAELWQRDKALAKIVMREENKRNTRHQPGEYEFPKRYFSNQQKRDWMRKHQDEMALLLWMRQHAEAYCWDHKPEYQKVPDSTSGSVSAWITEAYLDGAYEEMAKQIGISRPTLRKRIATLESLGFLAIKRPVYKSTKQGGRRQGTRFLLGYRRGDNPYRHPLFTWLEPATGVPLV